MKTLMYLSFLGVVMAQAQLSKNGSWLELGIDAGGTNTDIIVFDPKQEKHNAVLALVKAPTTPADPATGIENALNKINSEYYGKIKLVSLATTFATNALVENKGPETGIVLIGYDSIPPELERQKVLCIKGGHSPSGKELAPLDICSCLQKLPEFLQGVSAVAVSGFFSVRNPEHEKAVAECIADIADVPIVCAHTLSVKLNANKRAVTAWWNARLTPLLSVLISSVDRVLHKHSINAPLMLVRSDGTLMSSREALQRPVETVLSGPAASIMGGRFLSGCNTCLVADIGGTTTDMGMVIDGKIYFDENGAKVGTWETCVEGPKIVTAGLGGDSSITLDSRLDIVIGPRKAVPMGIAAENNGIVLEELKKIHAQKLKILPNRGTPSSFYGKDGKIVSAYRYGSDMDVYHKQAELARLFEKGLADYYCLTITDFSIADASVSFGCREASCLAIEILANGLGIDKKELYARILQKISEKITITALTSIDGEIAKAVECMPSSVLQNKHPFFSCNASLALPIIGLGGPASKVFSSSFDFLSGQVIIPEHCEGGVAIGAVVGLVDITLQAVIRADTGGYHVFLGTETRCCPTFENANETAVRLLRENIKEAMQRNDVDNPCIKFFEKTVNVQSGQGEVLFEKYVFARGSGRPSV